MSDPIQRKSAGLDLLRAVFAAGMALLFTQEVVASAPEWRVSERLTVTQLNEEVWLHTSWQTLQGGRRFPSNGLIVRRDEGLVLVDTAWGHEATIDLLSWIADELALPVVGALITHFHDDSMGGMSILSQQGIPAWSHAMTRRLGADADAELPASIGDLVPGEALQLLGLEVFYPGPGHTRDNTVVWVASSRLLFGTCMIRSPDHPGTGNTSDADISGWPVAVERVRTRYPGVRIVVPGHGPPGDAGLLTHTIGLFEANE